MESVGSGLLLYDQVNIWLYIPAIEIWITVKKGINPINMQCFDRIYKKRS